LIYFDETKSELTNSYNLISCNLYRSFILFILNLDNVHVHDKCFNMTNYDKTNES